MAIQTIKVPAAFIRWQVERDLDIGDILEATARTVLLRQTDAQRDEMISDARHWSGGSRNFDPYPEDRRHIAAARRLLASLERQGAA